MPSVCRAPRIRLLAPCLVFAVLAAGCAAPPDKEINQAVGAVEAARAAGAEQYAPDELAAAAAALDNARTAVEQRDYRLALSHALDARERAQDAARGAAAHRAEARSRAEVLIAQVAERLDELRTALGDDRDTRPPPRAQTDALEAADRAEAVLQEARTAVEREEYDRAAQALEGLADALQTASAGVAGAKTARPPRGRP